MAYSAPEIAVLKKYRILNSDGSPRIVELTVPVQPGGPPQGIGPLIAPDAVKKLLAADTTPDKRWLDWIFFQAGGGQDAVNNGKEALRQIRERFIDERTNGWTHPETGRYQPPVPREQAEARWVAAEPKFREVISVCDQDSMKRLRTFGYFRDWPGNGRIYEHVVAAITKFLKFFPKLQQMNMEVVREGGEQLPETPDTIPTYQRMEEITKKVERYHASKKARTDIRQETIYDDDNITALAPLTYAAAVKYGYDLWPWASRKNFEQVLSGEQGSWNFRDEWKNRTQRSAIVYLTFKVPVPAWMARRDGNWESRDLTDLALELNKDSAKENPDEWVVYDQENRNTLTIAQAKEMILAEPQRVDTADEETPFKRGANVYANEEEAQQVANSLDRAVKAVKKWLTKFDLKKIKSDVLTLD